MGKVVRRKTGLEYMMALEREKSKNCTKGRQHSIWDQPHYNGLK